MTDRHPLAVAPPPGTPIYLAARYSRRPELLAHAGQLADLGYPVTSRWLLGGHQADAEDDLQTWASYGAEDLEDLFAARAVVAFTEEPRTTTTRGGRHVEFGFVMGRNYVAGGMEVPLFVVGPPENVFTALPAPYVAARYPDAGTWLGTWAEDAAPF